MILIGLGNPGDKYKNNRHNAGFMFLDFFAEKIAAKEFSYEKKFELEISSGKYKEKDIVLLKPQTFMNLSGKAVRSYMDFYKFSINSNSFIVAFDDLDIKLGEWKLSTRGPLGHNGIKSIDEHTGVNDYMKIKIGVDNRNTEFRIQGEDYVLQDFTQDEMNLLTKTFENIYQNLPQLFS